MKASKKENKAIKECYMRLYKESKPSANFQELINNANKNIHGEKIINFRSHEIEKEKFESIVKNIIKEYKIKPKYRAKLFENTICLRCSPKIIDMK